MALLLALAALAMAPPSPCGWLRCGADLVAYSPREGDLVFFDDRSPAWTALFVLAGTGPPLHMGIVVRRLGGGMAILEAGPDDTVWVKLQDAGPRLRQVGMPDLVGLLAQPDALQFVPAAGVEPAMPATSSVT